MALQLKSRTCEVCGKFFTPQNYFQKICGTKQCFIKKLGMKRSRRRTFVLEKCLEEVGR